MATGEGGFSTAARAVLPAGAALVDMAVAHPEAAHPAPRAATAVARGSLTAACAAIGALWPRVGRVLAGELTGAESGRE